MQSSSHTQYTRWVEVKFWNGETVKRNQQKTFVPQGKLPPDMQISIAQHWKDLFEKTYEQPVKSVGFRYRRVA